MTDLTLYTNPQSRGRIAHWMMEELGEPYDTVWLDYGSSMKASDYLAEREGVGALLRYRDDTDLSARAVAG